MKDKIKYSFYTLSHPFDGFYTIRYHGEGSVLLATIYILFWITSNILKHEVTSFLYNETALQLINVRQEINKILILTILFCLGNWSITTLMEGKGRLRDIYIVFGYACLPISLINIPLAFVSTWLTYSESIYYNLLIAFGWLWFFFLLFTGIMTIHQYSLSKMLVTTVLTVIAMLVLAFIYLLFFNLISQFITFMTAIYQEISFRI